MRDLAAANMTSAQLAYAQRLFSEWQVGKPIAPAQIPSATPLQQATKPQAGSIAQPATEQSQTVVTQPVAPQTHTVVTPPVAPSPVIVSPAAVQH